MTTVSVYDQLIIRSSDMPAFICDDARIDEGDNLCKQAVMAMTAYVKRPLNVTIELKKTLPVGGGLGGGSGNAAAVLVALNKLFQLELSPQELACVGAGIGSDIPFFIEGGTQLVTGTGDESTPVAIPGLESMWFVLVNPGVSSSTAVAYADLDDMRGRGSAAAITPKGLDARGIQALDVGSLGRVMVNELQQVVFARFPVLEIIERELLAHGAIQALLCGSGATVFGLFAQETGARAAAATLQRHWPWVAAVRAARGMEFH